MSEQHRTEEPESLEIAFEEALTEALFEFEFADPMEVGDVRSFEHAGVLTYNRGVVVSMADGSEFQVTIVQSQGPA